MICLEQNKENIIALTLSENSTLESPNFLFEFKNDADLSLLYFVSEDINPCSCRYNRFIITLSGSTYQNLSASTVYLKNGSYTYNVYESSGFTLDYSSTTTNVLETGRVVVQGTDNSVNEIYK